MTGCLGRRLRCRSIRSFLSLLFLVSPLLHPGVSAPQKEAEAKLAPKFENVEFLKTDYEPLAKWLDDRFEVDYKHMTLNLVFDQAPLNDIFYETAKLPENAPEFHFESEDISRRGLLQKIARFWDLKMRLKLGDDGHPSAVIVTGPDVEPIPVSG